MRGWTALQSLRSALPIDPDSTAKQTWDFFMLLLLLYCSFSVPYEIAFLDNGLPVLDLFELLVPFLNCRTTVHSALCKRTITH